MVVVVVVIIIRTKMVVVVVVVVMLLPYHVPCWATHCTALHTSFFPAACSSVMPTG